MGSENSCTEHESCLYFNQISASREFVRDMLQKRTVKTSKFSSKICSKFTGEHSCRSAISARLQSNFIEITLRHGCSPINLLHIFGTPFPKNNSERLLLILVSEYTLKLVCLYESCRGSEVYFCS